jgi:SAM-dependent methyltransferase
MVSVQHPDLFDRYNPDPKIRSFFIPNFPQIILDMLAMFWTFGFVASFHGLLMPYLKEAMKKQGTDEIVDLCSGTGGPLIKIQHDMNKYEQFDVKVTLTDLYPPTAQVQKEIAERSHGHVQYYNAPVDATNVPKQLCNGFSTMFCSFHHMTESAAASILQDAVNKKRGIGIFEMQERSLFTILMMLILAPGAWLLTPLIRPFKFGRFFWTYIIPLVPLVLTIDGITSCLRTYSPAELEALIRSLKGHETYDWTIIQRRRFDIPPLRATFLIGTPKSKQG